MHMHKHILIPLYMYAQCIYIQQRYLQYGLNFEDVICSKYVQNMRTYTDTHICTYTIKMHVYIYTHTQVHTYIEHFRIFFPCEKEIPINVHMCVFPRLPFLTETKCKEMVKEWENYTLTTRFIGRQLPSTH